MGIAGLGKAVKGLAKGGKGVTRSMGLGQHALGLGMSVGISAATSNGDIVGGVAKGAALYLAEAYVPGAFMLSLLADAAGAVATTAVNEYRYGNARIAKYYQGNFGGNFKDTQAAYTMRQRGVQAIQQSQLNARSVLGSEARTFHTC